MKILLVEDEESIRGFLRINFQRENFQKYVDKLLEIW